MYFPFILGFGKVMNKCKEIVYGNKWGWERKWEKGRVSLSKCKQGAVARMHWKWYEHYVESFGSMSLVWIIIIRRALYICIVCSCVVVLKIEIDVQYQPIIRTDFNALHLEHKLWIVYFDVESNRVVFSTINRKTHFEI